MSGGASVRFWQPAPEVATDLVCAALESGEAPPHLHEEWQFGVLERSSKLSLGAYQRYGAQADDVTVVGPYEVHSEGVRLEAPPKWLLLYVAPAMIHRLYGGQAPRLRGPVITDPAAAAELRELVTRSADGAITGADFLHRVAGWLEQFLHRHAQAAVAPRRLAPVEQARAYLQSRPTEAITLAQLRIVAGITVSHLVRSFSRSVGLPPRSYHAQVRLAHARRLLAEGKSATWVAYECGFADQSHLSRRFKESYGVTPGGFQAQYRGQPASIPAPETHAA